MNPVIDHIASQFDRLPPHSIEAEMCYLASVMLDPTVLDETRTLINRESFYQVDHQIIFDRLVDLHRSGKGIDAVLLREELIRHQLLDEIGGSHYLGKILNTVPSAAHGRHYAAVVAEKAKLRQVISACNDALRACYAPQDDSGADGIASVLEAEIVSTRETGRRDTIRTLEEIAHMVLARLEEKASDRIETGLYAIDSIVGGLPVGGTTIISGRPGMGKSQLAKQIVRNVAGRGVMSGIISIEESLTKIGTNYLAGSSGVSNNALMHRRLTGEDWKKIPDAVGRLSRLPILVDDAQQKLSAIESVACAMARRGCKVIVVDHLHLVDAEADARANRTAEITKISSGLKFLWKKLGVCGVELAQENRGGADGERFPELKDLRDSGSLEQDGDIIMQLHRPDYFKWKQDGFVPDNNLHICINKNKDGGMGMQTVRFDGNLQIIEDWQTPDPF